MKKLLFSSSVATVKGNTTATENLARYIIRASFSQERMTYLPEPVVSLKVEREFRILYRSKDNQR